MARTCYDVHSPFVSSFLEHTLEDKRNFYIFDQIKTLRERLALNDDVVSIIDYGAGSRLGEKKSDKVKRIARFSAISPVSGKLLFKIVNFLHPKNMLELGTSLGVSAIYQLSAARNAKMITIEGNPEIAKIAKENIDGFGFQNTEVRIGRFSEALPKALNDISSVDFFHFDGDHRFQPTLEYFEYCLSFCQNDSVFCIGDIYWSAEMESTWKALQNHPRVRLSIDVFHFGLLFLRKEQKEKEHFTLIASSAKPWRMGFF